MVTLVLCAKPGLLAWIEPVRMFWYAAEREGRIEVLDTVGLTGEGLRYRLRRHLAHRPTLAWRALLVADDLGGDASLAEQMAMIDSISTRPRDRERGFVPEHRVLVMERGFVEGRVEKPGPAVGVLAAYPETCRRATVVRAIDPMQQPKPLLGRLEAALLVLALASPRLDGRSFHDEYHLKNGAAGDLDSGLSLRSEGDGWGMRAIVDAYVRRLEEASMAHAKTEPVEPVDLLGEKGRHTVGAVADDEGVIRNVPKDLRTFWHSHGVRRAPGPARTSTVGAEPDLPGGFLRRADAHLWTAWRDAVDRGVRASFDQVRHDARSGFEKALRRLQEIQRETTSMRIGEVRKSAAELQRRLDAREGVEDAVKLTLPRGDWTGIEAALREALTARPTLWQVVVAVVIGLVALLPAAILQSSLLSRVVSTAAVLGLEVGVLLWVRGCRRCWFNERSVLCRVATALKVAKGEAERRVIEVHSQLGEVRKSLKRQLETWALEQDLLSLRRAAERLAPRHAMYLYHGRMLTLHKRLGSELLSELGGSLEKGGARPTHERGSALEVTITLPESMEPIYAPHTASVASMLSPPWPTLRADTAEFELPHADLVGVRSITMVRCHRAAQAAD